MQHKFKGLIKIRDGVIVDLSPGKELIIDREGIVNNYGEASAFYGFADTHGHVAALGSKLNGLNLENCRSPEECAEKAREFGPNRGRFVVGFGWNHEKWNSSEIPNKKILDKVLPEVPVFLRRVDGHSAWANSKALQLAGVTRETPNPAGGEISRYPDGEPNGILIDNAMRFVSSVLPARSREERMRDIVSGLDDLKSKGFVEAHELDMPASDFELYAELDADGKLPIRVEAFATAQNDEYLTKNLRPFFGNRFALVGLKFYADGALGSRGAALLENYSDAPTKGLILLDEPELFGKAKRGLESGFRIATHAIGDAANRAVLNVYEKLISERVADSKSILRVEHAQMVAPEDQPRFAADQIAAAVQPIHCVSDAPMARKRTGARTGYSYPYNSLLKYGAKLVAGSDFPIEDHDPIKGLRALVERIPFGETEPWYPEERVSLREAVMMYSVNRGKFFDGKEAGIAIGEKAELTVIREEDLGFWM